MLTSADTSPLIVEHRLGRRLGVLDNGVMSLLAGVQLKRLYQTADPIRLLSIISMSTQYSHLDHTCSLDGELPAADTLKSDLRNVLTESFPNLQDPALTAMVEAAARSVTRMVTPSSKQPTYPASSHKHDHYVQRISYNITITIRELGPDPASLRASSAR